VETTKELLSSFGTVHGWRKESVILSKLKNKEAGHHGSYL
jgi:hypothetical protein